MAIIEILGPPGVGKTSLRKRLSKPDPGRKWDTRKQATAKLRGLPRLSKADRFLLRKKLVRVLWQEASEPRDTFVRIRSSWRCLYKDTLMRTLYVDRDVVNDDALFDYFLPEILALAKEDSAGFSALSRNRKFVILYSSPALVAENIRRRQDRGVYRTGVSSSTDERLVQRAEKYNSDLRSFADLCGACAIPFLAVSYDNNSDVDGEVLRFIGAAP